MERAAATALIGGKLSPGGRRSIDLAKLTTVTAPASPGAVAAHAVGRRLAVRATARAARAEAETELRARCKDVLPEASSDQVWVALRQRGWITKLLVAPENP